MPVLPRWRASRRGLFRTNAKGSRACCHLCERLLQRGMARSRRRSHKKYAGAHSGRPTETAMPRAYEGGSCNGAPRSDLPSRQVLKRWRVTRAELGEQVNGRARERGNRPGQSGKSYRACAYDCEIVETQGRLPLTKSVRKRLGRIRDGRMTVIRPLEIPACAAPGVRDRA
jgi:hypothetical protein